MSQHIPPALMRKFIEGDLEEPVAVAVALHIDHCSRCHAAASTADPLSQEFATIDDPEVPAELIDALTDAAASPEPVPTTEKKPRSNVALLVLAASLLIAFLLYPDNIRTDSEAQLGDTYGASSEGSSTQLVVGITIGLVVGAWLSFRGLTRRKKNSRTER